MTRRSPRRRGLKIATRRKLFSFSCTLPWIIGFAVFTLYPIIQSLLYSFSKTKFRPDASVTLQFVGLENYTNVLMKNTQFKMALTGYLQQMFFMVPMILVFALVTALFLNSKLRFRRVYRTIYFLPVILIQGVLYEIVQSLDAMSISGLDTFFVFDFISQKMPGVVSTPIMYIMNNFITIIWMSGVQILICLAGLQRIDRRIYEAASVDGASAWQSFWKITLPLSKPFIVLSGIYSVVDLSTSPLNPLISIIKNNMFTDGNGFGFSAAVTWIYFLLIAVLAALAAFLCNGCRIRSSQVEKKRRFSRRKVKAV